MQVSFTHKHFESNNGLIVCRRQVSHEFENIEQKSTDTDLIWFDEIAIIFSLLFKAKIL
jgi:hypothetical protein